MPTNHDIIQSIYANFAKGDVPAVLGSFDPQIEWREAEGFLYAEGNPYVGPQAIAGGIFQRIVTDVADFTVNPDRITDAGDTVLAEGRYRGTWKSNGRPINAQFAHVWQIRNGKVIKFHQYTDTRQWADAMKGR